MTELAIDTSWLDEPAPKKRPARKAKKRTAGKATTVAVTAPKLDHESLRGRAMFQAVNGRKRIWACDGEYVFFRRKSCYGINPATGAMDTNHRAISRHDEMLARGDYTYSHTSDDVEICKVNEQSPFWRKGRFLGEMEDGQVRRAIEIAAAKRDWVTYADALEELAGRIKNRGYDANFAAAVWKSYLDYIEVMIAQRGGPTKQECAAQLQNIRMKRGQSAGRVILLPGGR